MYIAQLLFYSERKRKYITQTDNFKKEGGMAMLDEQRLLKAAHMLSSLRVNDAITLKQQILAVLADEFNYQYSSFWELERGELHINPVRLNVTTEMVEHYLVGFQTQNAESGKPAEVMDHLQLLYKNATHTKSYYADLFQTYHFHDKLVMYLHDGEEVTAAICLLRKNGEPPFTEIDCQQLSLIKHTIENVYLLHRYRTPRIWKRVTKREEELLAYLQKGYKNADIAAQMHVSENTVKKHLQNLYRKFGATTRTELVMKYIVK